MYTRSLTDLRRTKPLPEDKPFEGTKGAWYREPKRRAEEWRQRAQGVATPAEPAAVFEEDGA